MMAKLNMRVPGVESREWRFREGCWRLERCER